MSSSANVRHQAGLPPRYHIKIQESFATATAARFGSAARWRTTILFTPPVWLHARVGAAETTRLDLSGRLFTNARGQ